MPEQYIGTTLFRKDSSNVRNKSNLTSNPAAARASCGTEHTIFYLTNIRTFQQKRKTTIRNGEIQQITNSKLLLRGKHFRIRSSPPNFCRVNKIAILYCKNGVIQKAKFTRIGCKSWTCPTCSIKKAVKVKYQLREIIRLNELGYFLTLTLDPKKVPHEYLSESENKTHKYITKLFNHFITVLKRSKFYNKNNRLKYVWVVEFQKNGNAHLHILFNTFLPYEEIKRLWEHVGGGGILWIEKVKTLEGISNYISDYIVKGIKGDMERPSGFRFFEHRYSISRSCTRPKILAQTLFASFSLAELFSSLEALGWTWVYNTLYRLGEEDVVIENVEP